MACNKRNTTLKCRTKKCIALSLVKPGHQVWPASCNTLLRSAPSCSIPVLCTLLSLVLHKKHLVESVSRKTTVLLHWTGMALSGRHVRHDDQNCWLATKKCKLYIYIYRYKVVVTEHFQFLIQNGFENLCQAEPNFWVRYCVYASCS